MPNFIFPSQDYLELLARRMRLSDDYTSSPPYDSQSQQQDTSDAMDTDDSEPITPDFIARFDKSILKSTPKVCPEGSLRERIINLQNRPGKQSGFNVLNYWSIEPDADLMKLAAVVLAVPVTQVTVERAFSALPLVLTDKRGNINDRNLNELLTIKQNMNVD